jgi:hypothetical protein
MEGVLRGRERRKEGGKGGKTRRDGRIEGRKDDERAKGRNGGRKDEQRGGGEGGKG